MSDRLPELLRTILAQPTAPFHEDAVRGELVQQLAQLPHVTTEIDDFGNLIARYARGDVPPRFALAAHMDHPGYVGGEFLGGVPESYRSGNPATRDYGAFAMWDLPACELREDRIYARACDDLVGCAAIVAAFQALEHSGAEASVLGLFTRAEEVGFVGALHLAQSGRIARDVAIISLECSSERGGPARMGEGVIVRVGDSTSVFDAAITGVLAELAKRASIPMQRLLMSGGACEATAYQLYGYRCGALCVALGNYHNCGPEETIAAEFVSLVDVRSMIALCTALAQSRVSPDALDAMDAKLRARLETRAAEYRRRFG
jgi:endoglucanase